jgi:hypothetical protein
LVALSRRFGSSVMSLYFFQSSSKKKVMLPVDAANWDFD